MHKGTHHIGKIPSRVARQLERDTALKTLQRDLQKAVADENYESAAQIRDQLRQLEETSADA
jgi:protein arginine kinase activator